MFNAAAPTVGERLRRARQDQGLELADVARDTRIPLRHLTALENDSHESLPALTYSLGFVRTYARKLGLPENETAAQFKAETTKSPHVPQTMPLEPVDEARLPSRGVVAGSTAAAVIVIAGLWAWSTGVFESDPPAAVAPEAAQVQAIQAQPTAAEPVAVAETPLVSGDTPVQSPDQAAVVPAAVPGAAQPVTQPPVVAGAVPPAMAGVPVVITASEDVWIKVYDAQKQTVKMGILAPGESYTVPTDRGDLMLWTGRAGALKVTVGGRAVGSLGGPRDTVQDVSLNPASLLARAG